MIIFSNFYVETKNEMKYYTFLLKDFGTPFIFDPINRVVKVSEANFILLEKDLIVQC